MNYNPGIQDQRGQIVMEGNAMSQRQGEMMAQLAGYFVNRANQAKSLRATIKAYNPDMGDAVDSMGVDQLEGVLKGWSLKNASDLQNARLADYSAQAQLRQQQAADDQSLGQALNRYANAPDVEAPLVTDQDQGPESPTVMRAATPDERVRYAMATPGLSGRAVPRLLDALDKYNQSLEQGAAPAVLKDNPYPGVSLILGRGGVHVVQDPNAGAAGEKLTPTYTEDPVTGARALLFGKTAQSTGFNPAKAAPQLVPQHDEKGNLVGWSQLDSRGHGTFIPNRTSAVLKSAVDESGNELPGYYVDSQGKLHDTRSAMEKTLGTKASPTPAPAKSTYKSTADVVDAYKAGKLSRDQAGRILNQTFGVPLK